MTFTPESPQRVSPVCHRGNSAVVHRVTAYKKEALWNSVKAWFEGGPAATGQIDSSASVVHKFPGRGGATWRIYTPKDPARREKPALSGIRSPRPWRSISSTFGYRWDEELVTQKDGQDGPLRTLPEYYRLGKDDKGNPKWIPVPAQKVPAETGLADVSFRPTAA